MNQEFSKAENCCDCNVIPHPPIYILFEIAVGFVRTSKQVLFIHNLGQSHL